MVPLSTDHLGVTEVSPKVCQPFNDAPSNRSTQPVSFELVPGVALAVALVSFTLVVLAEELQATKMIVAAKPAIIFCMCYLFRSNKIYFTICSASASESAGCGVIGTVPQFPEPPLIAFC